MGNCVGGFKQRTRRIVRSHRRTLTIAILGLDGSGKTTIVKALQGEGADAVHPTMGFSRGEFNVRRTRIVAYDLGGAERIRDIWKIYFAEIYAIVYVVDSAATSRLDETRRVVETLRDNADLKYKPIVFLLNKKDLPDAIDEIAFSDSFALHSMACTNSTDIRVTIIQMVTVIVDQQEGVCAIKGHGKDIDPMITESISWLVDKVDARYEQLNREIETAVEALKERQTRDRLDRQHRLAQLAQQTSSSEHHDVVEREADAIATVAAVPMGLTNGGLLVGDVQSSLVDDIEPTIGSTLGNSGGGRRRRSMIEVLTIGTHPIVDRQSSPPMSTLVAINEPDDMIVSARYLEDTPPVESGDVAVAAVVAPLEVAMRAAADAEAAVTASPTIEASINHDNHAFDETSTPTTSVHAVDTSSPSRPPSSPRSIAVAPPPPMDAWTPLRPASPQPSKIAIMTRSNNKIQPVLVDDPTITVSAKPRDVDFRIFETSGTKPTRLRTPLRRKSLDTRVLFSRGNRPSLLPRRGGAVGRAGQSIELAEVPSRSSSSAQRLGTGEERVMDADKSS